MPDLFPDIDIAIKVEPALFLERMMMLGERAARFTIEHHVDTLGGHRIDVVNFRLQEESVHEGHGFQLIARDENPKRVAVEIRAQRWQPDPPTRAVYEQSARDLLAPLLREYNRAYGTRHRLRIRSASGKGFRMSDRTRTLLGRFTILANTASLHPLDWRRFYQLVREGRQQIPGHILQEHLEKANFPLETARQLTDLYYHLTEYKRSS